MLGGGVLGLTVALRLQQRGHQVTLIEREADPGGLAAGFRVSGHTRQTSSAPGSAPATESEDVWLEKFYHHIFRSDTAIVDLITEVGLGKELAWRRPLTVTLRDGQPYQLDSPFSLLRFKPISLAARMRMGIGLAYLRFLPSPNALEGKTAASWVRSTMGKASYDVVWGPLLKGKFGAVADEIALPWFWARVHDRTAELGYVRGGFQRFYNRLAARLGEIGVDLHVNTEILGVERQAKAWSVTTAPVGHRDGIQVEEFDTVVSTLPTRLTCQLVPQLPGDYRARYEWGRAYGAHCLILALDRPLTQSYWMNVNDPGFPFMVLVEHTNYMPLEDYGGRHLIYLGNYRPMDDPLFRMSQEAVASEYVPHLARINPAFDPSWVTQSWMFAAPYAQPIVTTDYKAHIPPFETPLADLYIANMFQVYPHDRGQNYSVELAERLVNHMHQRGT